MAIWIKADAVAETVAPLDGKVFTLAELQRFVGGFIEALDLQDGTVMWLNEEGKLDGLPFNPVANEIAHRMSGIGAWDAVVGNVLIAARRETGDDEMTDEE